MSRWPLRAGALLVPLVMLLAPACRDEAASNDDAEAEPTLAEIDARIAAALPEGTTVQMARQGRDLFIVSCAACHDANGSGTALGPSLIDENWIHVTREMEPVMQVIRTGIPQPREYPVPMPPREGDFSDDQLRAVAAYVVALRGLQQ
jgi:mono/diheme cytochrome c family protein